MSIAPEFQQSEILCLEHENTRLYAEVIQVVPKRQLCWVRPLVLLVLPDAFPSSDFLQALLEPETENSQPGQPVLWDLRQGSDLICPLALFRTALDVEVIPVLAKLNTLKAQTEGTNGEILEEKVAHRQLQEFVLRLWQAHPEAFQ